MATSDGRRPTSTRSLASKRSLVWLGLLNVALLAGAASLPWYWVMFAAGGVEKQLTLSGFTALPLVSAQVSLGALLILGVMLSRGPMRTVLAWLGAALSALITFANAAVVFNDIASGGANIPPKLNTMIEKASGLAGGGLGGSSVAIEESSSSGTFGLIFVLLSVTLIGLLVVMALKSRSWTANEKTDKYSRTIKAAKADKTSKSAKSKGETAAESKDDNISLWDSQR